MSVRRPVWSPYPLLQGKVTSLQQRDHFTLIYVIGTRSPLEMKNIKSHNHFSLVYMRISTLLVEHIRTLCSTLSGTKYSKRSDFVGRVTIQVTGRGLLRFHASS
jgi:hypothetical protein